MKQPNRVPFIAQSLESRILFAFEMVKPFPGDNVAPYGFTKIDNQVVFAAERQGIWTTDGTTAGTIQLAGDDLNTGWQYGGPLILSNNDFIFQGDVGSRRVMWYSDGTAAGTRELSLHPGLYGGNDTINWGAALGNKAVVLGRTAAAVTEVFITDGTDAGTFALSTGLGGDHARTIAIGGSFNGLALFIEETTQGLRRLGVTDGTISGTRIIADLNTGTDAATLEHLTVANGVAYFQIPTGQGLKIWKSDGTAAGTGPIPMVATAIAGSMASLNGKVYFNASELGTKKLFRTDGSAGGTTALTTIKEPGGITDVGPNLVAAGGFVWFNVTSGTGQGIWRTDGVETRRIMPWMIARKFFVDGSRLWLGGIGYYIDLNKPDEVRRTALQNPSGNWEVPQIPFSFAVLDQTLIFPHSSDVYREIVPPKLSNIHVRLFDDMDSDGTEATGEGAYTSLSAYVYVDADNDGIRDQEELTSSINSDGTAVLLGYLPGMHTVRLVDPGARLTSGDGVTRMVVAGQDITDVVFGINRNNRVSGVVYDDQNANGSQQSNEPGIAGRLVYLDVNNNSQFDTGEFNTLTDGNGAYYFERLHGSGRLRIELPEGWRATQNGSGFSHSWYTNATETTFSPVGQTSLPVPGTIAARIFYDYDSSAVQSAAEPLVQTSISAFLDADNDGQLDPGEPQTSGSTGELRFSGVSPGVYTLRVSAPAGWHLTGVPPVLELAANGSLNTTAGIAPNTGTASISGRVFFDDDFDGTRDSTEPWRVALPVFLDLDANGVHDVGSEPISPTDLDGFYRFPGLGAGSYRVVTQASVLGQTHTYPVNPSALTVVYDGVNPVVADNMGVVQANRRARVFGKVYVDANTNGIFDAGDTGVPNALVTSLSTSWTTVTDANGRYELPAFAGQSTFRVTLPSGYAALSSLSATVNLVSLQQTAGPDFRLSAAAVVHPVGIRGQIFHDANGDGIQGFGEPFSAALRAPARVTPYLDLDGDGLRETGEPTGAVNDRGEFYFGSLVPGTYTVRMDAVSGASVSTPASQKQTFTLAAGELSSVATFGVLSAPASVTGSVWLDSDHDGVRTAADAPMVGAQVAIDVDKDGLFTGAADRTTLSSFEGKFAFSAISPGTYNIRVLPDGNHVSLSPTEVTIVLAENQQLTGVELGIEKIKGTLSGVVFFDSDRDGSRGNTEGWLRGWNVKVQDLDVPTNIWTAKTDNNGKWSVTGVAQGNFRVTLADGLQENYIYTTLNPRDVSLNRGESIADLNIGIGIRSSTLTGRVHDDANGNSQKDVGETGRSGVTVFADLNKNTSLDAGEPTAVTNVDGQFAFNNFFVDSNSIEVRIIMPAGTVVTPEHFSNLYSIVDAKPGYDNDMGERLLYTPTSNVFSGTVFEDSNGNGVRDTGEPGIAGRGISFDYGPGGIGQAYARTDINGFYAITTFAPQEQYRVRDILPPDWVGTLPVNGGFRVIPFRSDQTYTGLDFGSVLASAVGTIFGDGNGNGLQDAGESGVGGRTVFLDVNQNGQLDTGERTSITDVAGKYGLAVPAAGAYQIRQLLPYGSIQSFPASNAPHTANLTPRVTVSGNNFGVQALPPVPPTTSTLRPLADAHVRDGTYAGINYGSTAGLEVRNSTVAGNSRDTYFLFDLSQIPSAAQLSAATLRLFGKLSVAGSVNLGVYGVSSTAWTESAIKWTGKPAIGSLIQSKTFSATSNQWLTFDLTAYLKQQKQLGATKAAIAVRMTTAATPLVTFVSDEAPTGRPELVLTTSPTTSPPPTSPPPTSPPPTSPPPTSPPPPAATSVTKFNFQPAAAATVSGYLVDAGGTYGARNGRSYGWSTNHADVLVDRGINANQLLDTNVGVKAGGKWELAVPNGTYTVTVGVGDAGASSRNNVYVEGSVLFNYQSLAANAFASKPITVTVSDGKLTVGIGSAATGTTRIDYIEVASPTSPPPTSPPPTSPPPTSPPPTSPPPTSPPPTSPPPPAVGSGVKINFQPTTAPTVSGYLVDGGLTYAARNGKTYGWSTSHADVVADRGVNPNQLLDTSLAVKAGGKWELAVANGTYTVKLTVGDAAATSKNNVWIEGVQLFNTQSQAANVFSTKSITVNVADGRLTLGIGSIGGGLTKLDYIEVV